IVLVLPQPDSPSNTRDSPSGTFTETLLTATKSSYLSVKSLISISTKMPPGAQATYKSRCVACESHATHRTREYNVTSSTRVCDEVNSADTAGLNCPLYLPRRYYFQLTSYT